MKESKKREIVLWDEQNDIKFLVFSDRVAHQSTEFEGKIYPCIKIEAVKI